MRARRLLTWILFGLLTLGGSVASAFGGATVEYQEGAASALELAAVQALPNIQRGFSDFIRPSDPDATPVDQSSPHIDGVNAIIMQFEGEGFTGLGSMEELTGPDGEYLNRIGFEVAGFGDPAYYSTNPWATLYVARFTGEPTAPDGGVLGIALAWSWPGQPGLPSSPFPSDPLIGYANNAEEGTIAGQPFRALSSVTEDGTWARYENQLVSFDGPVKRDANWYFGWVVPGVPEKAAVVLSYATDPQDATTLISQQIEFDSPATIELPGLEMQYSDLTPTQQMDLDGQWQLVADADGAATTTTMATDTTSPAATTTPTTVPDDEEGDGVELPVVDPSWFQRVRVWFGIGFMVLFALFVARVVKTGEPAFIAAILRMGPPPKELDASDPEKVGTLLDISAEPVLPDSAPDDPTRVPVDDGPPTIDWGGPPGSEVVIEEDVPETPTDWAEVRAAAGAANEAITGAIVEGHRRAGGEEYEGGWIAPDEATVHQARYGRDDFGTTNEWSKVFINVRTGEWVEQPDPLHRELRDRFGIDRGSTEFDDGMGPIS